MEKMCETLGYLFCEFAFRWFDYFDDIPFEGDMENHTKADVKWYHRVIMGVGDRAYSIGCRFYNHGYQ